MQILMNVYFYSQSYAVFLEFHSKAAYRKQLMQSQKLCKRHLLLTIWVSNIYQESKPLMITLEGCTLKSSKNKTFLQFSW
jgi:hypothetical protein